MSRHPADTIAMTLAVLRQITDAARQGYFVRNVEFEGAPGLYAVTYGHLREGDATVRYRADGEVVA